VFSNAKLRRAIPDVLTSILREKQIYSGPEEVVVMAKVHPTAHMSIEQLSLAMDDLDRKIRAAMPAIADVLIGVTANRAEKSSKKRS
jgi:divalent metal cation (Fe/Co/Zn/Cd) transporter